MKKILQLTISLFVIALIIYSRFVGLDWGLPYHMHPDERNMVIAIQQMNCEIKPFPECLNPNFFAYGQFTLFLGLLIARFFTYNLGDGISNYLTYDVVALSLRFISAISSVLTVFVMLKIVCNVQNISKKKQNLYLIILSFVPVFIQSSHFGTTESLLQFFIALAVWISILFYKSSITLSKYVFWSGLILGISFATKVSSAFYAIIPLLTFIFKILSEKNTGSLPMFFLGLGRIGFLSIVFFIVFAPFNITDWGAFINSINYESAVGIGEYKAFYTRQFEYTLPIMFQAVKILPYAMGYGHYIFAILGFLFLPYKPIYNFMRISLLLIFLPHAFMYAKWTRFIAPVYPLLVIFSVLFLEKLFNILNTLKSRFLEKIKEKWLFKLSISVVHKIIIIVIFASVVVPGISYISIYTSPDVRFVASKYIYENIETGSTVLSETANVVDVPMPNPLIPMEIVNSKNINPISFNFYELHNEIQLNTDLAEILKTVDYVLVPSRRIFYNHTCFVFENGKPVKKSYGFFDGYEKDRCQKLKENYPQLNAYYENLFNESKFEKVAEFSSYAQIKLFDKKLIEFKDENAEETFTVFDHPVIRVYKKK